MDQIQTRQHEEYKFPYHYLPEKTDNNFRQGLLWGYSLSYLGALELIFKYINKYSPESICDIGCGDGALLDNISKQYPNIQLHGIDIDEKAINWGKCFNPLINYEAMDITINHAPKKYGMITLIEVIEHIKPDQINNFFSSVCNYMHDNSYIIITVPHSNIPLTQKHYQHFSVSDLRNIIKPFFNIKKLFTFDKSNIFEKIYKRIFFNKFIKLECPYINSIRWKLHKKIGISPCKEKHAERIFLIAKKLNKV